ncbi:MAG: DUF4126 domain-containing protein [Verrucomicrobiota bacterium]
MEVLETLAVALGFATLAGLNLYLVVLVTGLAINQGWVDVSSTYPELMVLGDPAVITVAGIFFCMEFFSDKVPWVDSLWDTVHTLVRPVGGGLLAIHTLGPTEPAFEVIIALLAGGTTMVAHGFKSGTRLAINASPEPISNVAASVTEDLAVLGGLVLLSVNPLLAAGFCLVFLAISAWLTPKLFRRIKAFVWLVSSKVSALVSPPNEERLLNAGLSSAQNQMLGAVLGGRHPDPVWSAKVLVAKSKLMPGFVPMTFGRLIAESDSLGSLHFVGRRFFRNYYTYLNLDGLEINHESKLFSEDIVLYDMTGSRKLTLRLPSGHRDMATRVVESLKTIRNRDITNQVSDRLMMA